MTFTSAAELALAKRKHTCDMGSVQRSASARSAVVLGDGGAVIGVVPQEASARSPKHTSAAELRAEKAHHRASFDAPPRAADAKPSTPPQTTSWEEIREQKVKHMRSIPHDREGVTVGDESATPSPAEDTKLVSIRQLNREKKHHRHIIGKPDDANSLKLVFRPSDGPQGSQRQLQKLKRNHDHTLEGEYNGCSPQRDTDPLVTEAVDPDVAVKSCSHLTKEKRHHHKDMTVQRSGKPQKAVSNEEYTYDKKRHRHTVELGANNKGGSANPNAKGPVDEAGDGKCTSHKRMDRKKQFHSHQMDTHRGGYSSSPTPAAAGAADGAASAPCKVKSNIALHSSIRRHKHEMDGSSPQKPTSDHRSITSNTQLLKEIRGHKHAIGTSARPEIFKSVPPPVITPAESQ